MKVATTLSLWSILATTGLFSPRLFANPFDDHVDKAAHFGLSSVLVQASMRGTALLTNEPLISPVNRIGSSIFAFGIGVAKEVYDKRRGSEFSYSDLAADGLGVLTGNLLLWEF